MNPILRVFCKHEYNNIKNMNREELCNEVIDAYNNGYSIYYFEMECNLDTMENFLKDLNRAVQKSQMGTLLCGFYSNSEGYDPYDEEKVKKSKRELQYQCCDVSGKDFILLAIDFD